MESMRLELPHPGEFECFDRERLLLPQGNLLSRGRLENEAGMAPEVLGLAPWEVSSRRIAASASARMGTLIALESPRERGALPQLLLDQRTSLDFGSTTQTIRERIATLGLGLARILTVQGPGCQVRCADERGLSRVFPVKGLSDWQKLYLALKGCHLPGRPEGNLVPHRWIALFSDNEIPQTPIQRWLRSRMQPLGLVCVYDPWEENPPQSGGVRLMNQMGSVFREDWSNPKFREALSKDWNRREVAWNSLSQGSLIHIKHRTDAHWQQALAPWFRGHIPE